MYKLYDLDTTIIYSALKTLHLEDSVEKYIKTIDGKEYADINELISLISDLNLEIERLEEK